MLKFTANGNEGAVTMNLPTSLSEITPEYLLEITKSVKIADNYSLIAILYRESLSGMILASSQKKKQITTSIVAEFVKAGNCDTEFINSLKPTERIIISPSDVALGYHVSVKENKLTPDRVLANIVGDKNAYQNAVVAAEESNTKYCYFLEFKLVPNANIHGSYSLDSETHINPNTAENEGA